MIRVGRYSAGLLLAPLLTNCFLANEGSPVWVRGATETEIMAMSQEGKDGMCQYAHGARNFAGMHDALVKTGLLTPVQLEELRTRDPWKSLPKIGDTRCHIFALLVWHETSNPTLVTSYDQAGSHYEILRKARESRFSSSEMEGEDCRDYLLRNDIIVDIKPCNDAKK